MFIHIARFTSRAALWMVSKGIIILTILFILLVLYLYHTLPSVGWLRFENPENSALIRARGGRQMQFWTDYYDISDNLKKAVLVAEDRSFFWHSGVDPHEMKESLKKDIKEFSWSRGASTITMQLAKNLFLSSDKTLLRKLKELILTYKLEKRLPKVRIFEIYLNIIEWGRGVYGAEAASRYYFRKSSSDLTPEEAAYLAAIIPNPNVLTKEKYADEIEKKMGVILRRMDNFHLPP